MMADMITLIFTDLLRGARTRRALVLENSRYGTNWPSCSAPRRVHGCGRRPAALGPAIPPLERLDRCRLHRPTRYRDPMAADRLQALLGLEEPPEWTGPPGRRPGGPNAHPTDVHVQPPSGARRGFTGNSRNSGSRSRKRRYPSTWSAIGGRHRRLGGPFSTTTWGASSASISSSCRRRCSRSCSSSWFWRTIADASSTSTSLTPPGRRPPSSLYPPGGVRTSHRHAAPRVPRPRRGAERNPSTSSAEPVPHLLSPRQNSPLAGQILRARGRCRQAKAADQPVRAVHLGLPAPCV
jgi:hypothetical protein